MNLPLILKILTIVSWTWYSGLVKAQAPENDECFSPKLLPENTWLEEDNYHATLSPENARPPKYPITCIQTYENDLWYHFQTTEPAEYQITIVHHTCNTPAGLQALLLEGDACLSTKMKILACSNRKIADTIKIFFSSPAEVKEWLLYIDGYDGTVCSFDIQLKKAPGAAYSPDNLAYNRFYSDTACPLTDMQTAVKFENNKPVIQWTDPDSKDVSAYIVERVGPYTVEKMAVVRPEPLASGYRESFEYTDNLSLLDQGDTYSFRISRIDKEGNRSCTGTLSSKAKITRDFFVTEPIYTGKSGIYQVSYFNRKKQDYTIAILDETMVPLKSLLIKNLETGESISKLDLTPYPPGVYYFKMTNGRDDFVRKIEKHQ